MNKSKIFKSVIYTSLTVLMIFSILILALQLNAKKLGESQVATTTTNSTTIKLKNGEEAQISSGNVSINDIEDWKSLSDEELIEVINATTDKGMAVFVYSLDEEETALLLSKKTSLINPVIEGTETGNTIKDENGEEWPEVNFVTRYNRYYDYLVQEFADYVYGVNPLAWNEDDWNDTSTTGSGQFTLKIVKEGKEANATTNITFRVSNVTRIPQNVSSNNYTITTTSNGDNWVTQGIKIESDTASDNRWEGIVVNGTFNKPTGYYATWEIPDSNSWYNMQKKNGGRFSTHDNEFLQDTLSHSHGGTTTSSVRIQCNSKNCGLSTKSNQSSITGMITMRRFTESLELKPNGGTVSQTNFSGKDETSITLPTPTRPGYIFTGWSIDPKNPRTEGANGTLSGNTYKYCVNATWNGDFGDTHFKDDYTYDGYWGNYTNTTGKTTLIANWKYATYTLTVKPNGGTWENSKNNQNFTLVTGNTKLISAPTRPGFTFTGWTKESGAGSTITSGTGNNTFTMGTENASIIANWKRNNYTLTVIPNGGTWENSKNNQNFTLAYEAEKDISNPTRTGYNFTGWILNPTDQGSTLTQQTNGQKFKMGYANASITAQWEAWALKANIAIKDNETKNIIQDDANTKINIYEWDSSTGGYTKLLTTLDKNNRKDDGTYETPNYLTYTDTNLGKFRIIEYTAPYGYYGDWEGEGTTTKVSHDINIEEIIRTGKYGNQTISDKGTVKLVIENQRVKGDITVNVIDSETKAGPQGDALLDGAVYALYARENIMHPDGVSNNFYFPGDEVARATVANGQLKYENMEQGSYYVKQISTSEGYIANNTQTPTQLTYKDEATLKVYDTITVEQVVKKQAFRIIKVGDVGTSDELVTLEGAGFKAYLISSLSKVQNGEITKNENGTYNPEDFINYDFTNEKTALTYVNTKDGENIPEMFTDEEGFLTSPELAYGNYIIVETTVPAERAAINPFTVNIEDDSRTPKKLRVFLDREFKSKVKVVKTDTTTLEKVLKPNASYRILNTDTNEYVEQTISYPKLQTYGTAENPYKTDETGTFTTPATLSPGNYELQEVAAPNGYVLSGKEGKSEQGVFTETPKSSVKFTITNRSVTEYEEQTGDPLLTVTQYNDPVVGSLDITLKGEFLKGYTKDEKGEYTFQYEERPIAGARFNICAKEDIYSQDNQGTIIYKKDEVVGTATTNDEGKLIIDNIPLGKYYIKQTETISGFSINFEQKEVDFEYEGQNTPVVYRSVEYTNARHLVEINLTNKNDEGELLPGGLFELYTKEDITYTGENGETQTIPAGELVYTVTADENGVATWKKDKNVDLPISDYYIKQVKAPEGYILNDEIIDVEVVDGDEDVIKINLEIINIKTGITIRKINSAGENIEGVELQLLDSQGNVIETIVTTKEEYVIKGLKVNEVYTLRETKTAVGYVTAADIKFKLDEKGTILSEDEQTTYPNITMVNEKTKVTIIIVDEDTKEPVPGVKVEVKDKNTGETVYEYESTKGPEEIEGLPVGDYEVIQKYDKDGYVTTVSEMEIEDLPGTQEKVLEQKKTQVLIKIYDEADEDKTNIKDIDVKIIDKETGETIGTPEERDDGYYIKGIPVGDYEIKIKTPDGYKEIDNVPLKVEDTEEVQKKEIPIRKLKYDALVEKTLAKVIADGEELEPSGAVTKIEIKSKQIKKVDMKLRYNIKVANVGETTMTIGTIIDELPNGLELSKEDSKDWTEENGTIKNSTLAEVVLNPGESREVTVVAKWKNDVTNFGEKTNIAKLQDSTNPYGYPDSDPSNDIGKVTSLIFIGTGLEVGVILIYAAVLITLEFAAICIVFKIRKNRQR